MAYDYLIVGTGLFGSVFAHEAAKRGHTVKMLEKRTHIGGNCYTEKQAGIDVHKYGAHIFHTSSKKIWDYINQFTEFYPYIHAPIANYQGELYNLPFNMNTFYQLWGTKNPAEARTKIMTQIEKTRIKRPRNLEEQALSLVGPDIYHKLIKGYTEKQWGRELRIFFKEYLNWVIHK
jgi:UDP-galactopyranose mutase